MMTFGSNTNLVVEWAVVLIGITVDTTVIFTTAAFKALKSNQDIALRNEFANSIT